MQISKWSHSSQNGNFNIPPRFWRLFQTGEIYIKTPGSNRRDLHKKLLGYIKIELFNSILIHLAWLNSKNLLLGWGAGFVSRKCHAGTPRTEEEILLSNMDVMKEKNSKKNLEEVALEIDLMVPRYTFFLCFLLELYQYRFVLYTIMLLNVV